MLTKRGVCLVRLMAETSIDLNECDREPIHVPGSIQPHGVLLVTERGSLRILQVAGETDRMLGRGIGELRNHKPTLPGGVRRGGWPGWFDRFTHCFTADAA